MQFSSPHRSHGRCRPGLHRRAVVLAAAGLCARSLPVAAQAAYPDRPIQFVVPFAPGGASDTLARMCAEGLAQRLGVAVVPVHKPGAGTQIGLDAVAKAAADGYTLLLGTSDGFSVLPAVKKRLPYDATKDFTPIARIASTPLVIAVSSRLPVRTLSELIALAKAKPGSVRCGHVGQGSSTHIAGVYLDSVAGIKTIQVPYKGMAPAVNDLLAGHIDLVLTTPLSVVPHAGSDRIRLLAVSSRARVGALPAVPTAAEAGFGDFNLDAWWGVFAPSKIPPAIAQRLSADVAAVVRDPAFVARLNQFYVTPALEIGSAFEAAVRQDASRWKQIAESHHITADEGS